VEVSDPQHIQYLLNRVEEEIARRRSDLPDTLKLKEAEPTAPQRRLANFVGFVGEGRGSPAPAKALVETERRVGRPFYHAITTLDALALIETPSDQTGAEGGSNSLRRWRRRESNPRPQPRQRWRLRA
jgi:hypothetical protein